jgi:hypothetical protein
MSDQGPRAPMDTVRVPKKTRGGGVSLLGCGAVVDRV